jgi:mannose-1-phosphate guanylyltransferase
LVEERDPETGALAHLHAVILAGGKGTRFWPLSTARRPKQLRRIAGDGTMIQETAARLAPLVPASRLWVVTAAEQAAEVARQLPQVPPSHQLVEPRALNTAPAIALAAHQFSFDPQAIMAVLPADHAIGDPEAFRRALAAAAEVAARHPVLVTLGIMPTRPETGYGYIERGAGTAEVDGMTFYEVAAFREKPDRETAQSYLAGGQHAWNAGVFVFRAGVMLEEIGTHLPDLSKAMTLFHLVPHDEETRRLALAHMYEWLQPISIDYGVLERSRRTWVVPVDCGWNDVGSWSALHDVLPRDAAGNVVAGDAILVDTKNAVVHAEEGAPLVTMIGMDDVVVIATPTAVLVCPRDRAQEVRAIVDELARRGRTDLL